MYISQIEQQIIHNHSPCNEWIILRICQVYESVQFSHNSQMPLKSKPFSFPLVRIELTCNVLPVTLADWPWTLMLVSRWDVVGPCSAWMLLLRRLLDSIPWPLLESDVFSLNCDNEQSIKIICCSHWSSFLISIFFVLEVHEVTILSRSLVNGGFHLGRMAFSLCWENIMMSFSVPWSYFLGPLYCMTHCQGRLIQCSTSVMRQ